jgi:murein DD-endopeptidase MepM/ murein hydrolase activator NlpD
MEAEAIALVERARGEVHRIDVARTELRSEELEVLEASIALEDRVSSVRSGLRRARLARQELYADMELAELLVASQLTSWRGPDLGDVSIALDGVLRVCPVDEPMTYTDNWHAPRWGGGFHLHQGIDIFAPTGTAIRAPFDGIAVVADNWLGGLAVKVYGDGGYVYNAHLSAHGMLGQVEAGDIIGFVGSTGNASGPHDHFEYHPGNGEAVNPFPFLNAVC